MSYDKEKMTSHQYKIWMKKKIHCFEMYCHHRQEARDWKEEFERLKARLQNVEIESGPENTREEVTGLGGKKTKNRNSGNSGFSGGMRERVAPALFNGALAIV